MKTLLFVLLLLGFSRGAIRADIPPPTPTVILVTNLAAYPGYRFSYSTESGDHPKLTPLKAQQTFKAYGKVRLFVEDASGARSEWASFDLGFRGATETISIEDVHKDGKKIEVRYKTKHEGPGAAPSGYKGASASGAFVISGLCGAVLLLRRRRFVRS